MTKKAFTLKIEKPCSQNWDSMYTNAAGKYCHQCSKNVIDLTKLSDTEILAIIKRTNGELCGRITKKQSERVFIQPQEQYDIPKIRKMVAGLLLLSGAGSAIYGQNNAIPKEQVPVKSSEEKKSSASLLSTDTIKNVFHGTVATKLSEETLAGATIRIAGTRIGTTADLEGKFKLQIPADQLKDSIHFEISYIGYEIKYMVVSKNDLSSPHSVYLQESMLSETVSVTAGNIEIQSVYLKGGITTETSMITVKKKAKWWKRKHW
jgi:hypothetical protein